RIARGAPRRCRRLPGLPRLAPLARTSPRSPDRRRTVLRDDLDQPGRGPRPQRTEQLRPARLRSLLPCLRSHPRRLALLPGSPPAPPPPVAPPPRTPPRPTNPTPNGPVSTANTVWVWRS